MKNRVLYLLLLIAITLGTLVFVYGKPKAPRVGEDGRIIGVYSIQNIMSLGIPYECTFLKSDQSSQVSGVIRMAEGKLRGDFDITVNLGNTGVQDSQNSNFASHFIAIDDITYTWTSLQPVGYKNPTAESAEKNASPAEQAQIIGIKDKVGYICELWSADFTMFELPSGITFLKLE